MLQTRASNARRGVAARLRPLALRRLRAAVMGAGAIGLLGLALDSAGASGISAWIREETPDPVLLSRWAEKRGMRALAPADVPSSVWRSLPSRGASESPVWISEDDEWVAIYGRAEDPLGPRVLCVRCRRKPEAWRDLGPGWQGVRAYASWAASGPAAPAPPEPRPESGEVRDPREFRY